MFGQPRPTPATPSAQDACTLSDLRLFHEAARAITSALDRTTVLHAILSQMERVFRPGSWSLLLLHEDRHTLEYVVRGGRLTSPRQDPPLPIGEGMAGWVALHGEPLIVAEIEAFPLDDRPSTLPCRLSLAEISSSTEPIRSAINLPLQSRGQTLGVLQIFNYRLESLNDSAIIFLNLLADYAAIAIENIHAVERIQQLTITDDCTRLYNTRHLHASLRSEFERARRFSTPFSVIFLDLDHFKRINDAHGHLIGTELLVEIAALLKHVTRAVDSVFRYGGDEFVILLPQTQKQDALEAAERLQHTLRSELFLAGRGLNLHMTASIGVSTYPQDGSDPESVLQAADNLMYSIKRGERDSIASTL